MQPPLLNDDVLCIIASYLPTQDAVHYCATSRDSRRLVMQSALASVSLTQSAVQVEKFCMFMLGDVQRPLWLKELEISMRAMQQNPQSDTLARLIAKSHCLRRLSITPFEELLIAAGGPALMDACVTLTHLVDVKFGRSGSRIFGMLRKMPDQCRGIRRLDLELQSLCDIHFDNVFGALAQFQQLETLRLSDFKLHISPPHNPVTTHCMKTVRNLGISYGMLPMSLATQMFPDIQSLEFRQTRNGPDYDDATTGTAGWEDLNHLRTSFGESMMDDAWKLHRRVRWLDLTVIRWFRHGGDVSYLHRALAMVEQSSPVILSCQTTTENLKFWTHLPTYSSQLRYLELVLVSTTLSLGTELASWQERVATHIGKLPILGLFVCVRVLFDKKATNARLRATGAATDIVDAIISSSSSIRYIGFTISTWLLNKYVDRYPPLSEDERETAMWWRVVDDAEPAGGRHPVHLYREQGERIRDYFHQADYDSPSWTDGLLA